MKGPTPPHTLLLVAALTLAQGGCERAQGPPSDPIVVVISQPLERKITDFVDYTGRTDAVESVDVRPRVSGYLMKIPFKSGAEVKKDELLFLIDPRPYQADVDQAKADVERAIASVKRQQALADRATRLLGSGGISREDYEKAVAEFSESQATVESNKAKLATAKLNLEWTEVRSPIKGRVGRNLLTVGNLVEKDKTLLTTIVSQDPIWAYFDVDDYTMQRFKRMVKKGELKSYEDAKIPVFLGMPDEKGFPHQGVIDYVSPKVTSGTGTVTVRGEFPNPDRLITPGLFVRIRVHVGDPHEAILVNEDALGSDQGQKYVLVVNAKNEVVRHNVEVGSLTGGLREIVSGLNRDEWVITDGLLRVRPGVTVEPRRQPMPVPAGAEPEEGKGSKK
jgi:RND family efflux transporter MFP subunit